jgi:hypothetical protein
VAQYDYEYFKKQLVGLPPKAQAIIALRAAMRALPSLARRGKDTSPFAHWKEGERDRHVLAIIRCYQASAFANGLAKADRASASAAALAANDADALAANDAYAAASAAASHAYAAASHAAYAALAAALAADASAAAILADIQGIKAGKEATHEAMLGLLTSPLWPTAEPPQLKALLPRIRADLKSLRAGFEVWIDWYQDRLDGKPFDWEIERQWALLSKEQLSQSPAQINAYLKGLRERALTKQFKRVRAIFIGHGEVGKTSLIRALHGEDVIAGREAMTQGVAIKDAIHEQAGVFTRVTDYRDDDLTVHFWDFGGQVMAHATHQFFLRSKCLYVIVLAGRAERNPNEEAEYWLEHVRAFGDSAPVLLVGNKADVMPVSLDLQTLKCKYPNIVEFHSISCTGAKGAHRKRFELFRDEFIARLQALGKQAERFSPAQFRVLKIIEQQAAEDDFIKETGFDEICQRNSIAMQGPGGRDTLLDIFDKLGIVMHFAKLTYLADYVLNPRWLTYGVYTLMYSEEAKAGKGRLSETALVAALGKANPNIENGRIMRYRRDRCHIIADAMIAFRVAYRLGTGELVIPALLAPEQPEHDFRPEDALAFRFDFGGFLPRHLLPALIVENFRDIGKVNGAEVVWQNGVLLRPKRLEAEALVRADYHTRTIDFLIKGGDGQFYLGMLRESILATLETMPLLPYEEKLELRPDMRADSTGPSGGPSVWMSYGSIFGAYKRKRVTIDGPDGKEYALNRVLAAAPVKPELQQADVFLSYSSKDGAQIEKLDSELASKYFSVGFDRGLIAG